MSPEADHRNAMENYRMNFGEEKKIGKKKPTRIHGQGGSNQVTIVIRLYISFNLSVCQASPYSTTIPRHDLRLDAT